MTFFEKCVQKKNDFLKRRKKKIDKRKSRKVMMKKRSLSLNNKTHKEKGRRMEERTGDETPKQGGFKKQRHDFIWKN